ncbi:UNVERIFIED_CONTAM: DNA polymerase zeta catalytic subunit [Sesamum radiatum]|uniref:DNA polymerase n=1 Tax=Sesamum radiatum TaxID=300843 RepID=A0AAW2UBX6_SESRA
MKFRCPVPDAFSERKVKLNGVLKPLADDSSCMDFQADVDRDLCLNTPIWISSTIPDGWIWQYSPIDSSSNEDIPLFRRQSTCELEGDAVVHDIINQQFISYAPLSQTHSEVKMVQSLIPIWEEEYERNGVPDAIPPDSHKPLPQDVLRILSDGLEIEKLMEVRDIAESSSLSTPEPIESSKDCGDVVGSGIANLENSNHLPCKYLKASDRRSLLSSDSPFQNVDAAETNEIDAAAQPQISCTMEPSSAKATDEDALRLLKWLASSQAAKDINSDDELAHETILSPLLPPKDIDKVLERTNVDYESESQKECQDILDSIDMLNFEELNDRAFNPAKYNHSSKVLSNEKIPQVDGSGDDVQSTSCSNKSIKAETCEAKPSLEVQSCIELDSDLVCKHRRKRPRWGSLPISCEKVNDVSHPETFSVLNGCNNEKEEGSGTSWFGNEAEEIPCLKVDQKKDLGCTEQARVIVECSTRDLMRRKRSHRVENSECMSPVEYWKAESCSDAECEKRNTNLDTKLWRDIEEKEAFLSPLHIPPVENEVTKCHERNINSAVEACNEAINVKPSTSCSPIFGKLPLSSRKDSGDSYPGQYLHGCVDYDPCLQVHSCNSEHAHVSKREIKSEEFGCMELQTGAVGSCTATPNSALSDLVTEITGQGTKCETTLVHFDSSPDHGSNASLSKPYDTSENVNKEAETVKLIGMTFSKKPPMIDWMHEPENEAPMLLGDGGHNLGTVLQGRIRSTDNCLPFFMRNCQEEELLGVSPSQCKHIDNNEPVMGVPIIYQNDGSCLLILTPAVSPPSRESVDRWLSFDYPDTWRHKIEAESACPPISKEFSVDMVDSQGSQSDDSNCPLPESASLLNKETNFKQRMEQNQESCCVKVKTLNEVKENLSTGCSQDTSQISGPDKKMRLTPLSQIGFRDPASAGQGQQLTLLSIEVQAESRGDLRPDPRFDAINVIVLVIQEDDESTLEAHVLLRCDSAYVEKDLDAVSESKVVVFTEELQLFNHFTKVVRASDPDVLMGWDIQSGSLGFLAERAAHIGVGLLNNISRTPSQINVASGDLRASQKEMVKEIFSESATADAVHLENMIIEDEWGRTHASGVHVGGRIVLNVWRLMRNEVKLNMYTVEAVGETVLRRKIPYIPSKIMNQLDMINRTSELARVFGIDFFSVLSRGSQYRVESMFLRLAHTQNYLAISPGSHQVANQPAMECLPLVMEPESSFYADPVIVLDFQSLYPSMVIAYNLCFCTCLGKITPTEPNILGVSSYIPDMNTLRDLKRELLVTPNGVTYVPSEVRKGILPRLLEEILSTRIMVKRAMKNLSPSQLVLHRILNARQLALKLIANVTYGYTAAGFSGRMPCAELADSIVQCGRRTLETAISFVNSNDKWNARVVYGDTDSMFVLLKGRSLKEAFTIGQEIALAITEMNPTPVTLKMEKVYYPCFLLTKKRYVGYSYESPHQSKPIFDAKGIETVRRDTCGAVSKTLEQSLRIYFESHDIDKVKAYMLRQWTRILSGRVSLQDFVFAKEVRLGTYSARASSLPPAAIVATKSMRADPRAEPRYAERIPYVVVHGEPGARLVDLVVDPYELLAINSSFRLNDIYYIRKQIIPALQRVFGLVGADLNQWFLDMPRPGREAIGKRHSLAPNPQRMRIDYYYASRHCIICGDLVQGSAHLCPNCSKDETTVAAALTGRTSKLEMDIQHLAAICRHCGGGDWVIESGVKCVSLACSVFYERMKVQKELQSLSQVAARTGFYPKCMVDWF